MTGGQRGFQIHATVWFAVNAFLFMVWLITGAGFPWFLFPAGGWGIGLAAHAAAAYTGGGYDDELEPGESYRELR
ncbi:MAG TPA: 2TM domain-containing protein [Acidimicrobiales bacterium]